MKMYEDDTPFPEPPLSPLEADALLRVGRDPVVVSGWLYYLDGPQMCPPEAMAPVAVAPGYGDEPLVPDVGVFFTSGELDDPVTEDSHWVQV